jgi:uncharacterized protein (TIGR02145 family)
LLENTVCSYNYNPKVLAKFGTSSEAINDNILIIKDGFINYRRILSTAQTSGMVLKMIVCAATVTDADGNIYQAVKIGNQVWTTSNLRTTKYNDLTQITLETSQSFQSTGESYCYYNNTDNIDSIKLFGALYNWYVVDSKKMAPVGWHVPSKFEWDTLINYLIANGYNWDGTKDSNKVSKAMAGMSDWESSANSGAIGNDLTLNNACGFSGLPGGYRDFSGIFYYKGSSGLWWEYSHYESDPAYVYYRWFHYDKESDENIGFPMCKMSVRLLKD